MAQHPKTLVFFGQYQDVFPAFTCVKTIVANSQPGIEFI